MRAEPSGGGDPSEGSLSFVDNAVDTSTGTILLKGRFPNDDGSLWPGGFVNVRLQLYVEPNALVVPAAAVVSGQQGSFVFVIQPDSSAATKAVTVSRTAGDFAIVSGDVQAGDRVVIDGQLRLRQGSKVQIKAAAGYARGWGRYELHRALHPPPGHDHAGHGRHSDLRTGGVPAAAGERSPGGGLSHDLGERQPARRQPRDHGVLGGDPAGKTVLHHPRRRRR